MRSSESALLFFLAGILFLFAIRAANAEASRNWTFVDTKSGGFAVLSGEESRLIVAESGFPVDFCAKETGMACFSSEMISFAIPSSDQQRDSWTNGVRVYCVVRRFRDAHDNERPDGALLIYSRQGEQCGGEQPYDQVAIFSRSAGLRMIRSSFASGGFLELWAVDAEGFGSEATR